MDREHAARRSTPARALWAAVLAGVLAMGALGNGARAQTPLPTEPGPLYIGSQRVPVQVRATAVYQRFESDHGDLTQLALPLSVTLPLARNLGLSVHTHYVTTEGDTLAAVGGMADTQVGVSYYRAVGSGSTVVTVGINLPSGQRGFTVEEAETAFLVGQGFYGFSLPSLGQGFSVSPGLTYAIPVGERIAAGAGVSYQYRGAFRPSSDVADDYDPGDELAFTGGVDYRLTSGTALSIDLTYVAFGTDTWGDLAYGSGDAVTVTAQARSTWRLHEVHLLGRLRSKGDSERSVVVGTPFGADSSIPAQARALARARFRVTERIRANVLLQARYYEASALFDEAKTVADVGVGPEVRFTPRLAIVGRARLSFGDVSGFELGGGLTWSL